MAGTRKKTSGEATGENGIVEAGSAQKEGGQSLEAALAQLDEIMERLEQNDISLEDSFRLYQQGMQLVKQCNDSIDRVEKQLLVLEEEGI